MTEIPHWTEGPLPDKICARVIADSVSVGGHRITTFECRYNRYFHSELLTHTMLSRNSSSSRAIPYPKLRQQIVDAPASPIVWASNQSGMQGAAEIPEVDEAQFAWLAARDSAVVYADLIHGLDVHKSIPNRIIEPWMLITVTVTAVDWQGFFNQRSSHRTDLVLPEFGLLAANMEDLYTASTPELIREGEWHTPYIRPDERSGALSVELDDLNGWPDLCRVSTARCARTSYLTQTGQRDLVEDFLLFDRLRNPGNGPQHASPFQHVATPAHWNEATINLDADQYGVGDLRTGGDDFTLTIPIVGNTRGWLQLRHVALGW